MGAIRCHRLLGTSLGDQPDVHAVLKDNLRLEEGNQILQINATPLVTVGSEEFLPKQGGQLAEGGLKDFKGNRGFSGRHGSAQPAVCLSN